MTKRTTTPPRRGAPALDADHYLPLVFERMATGRTLTEVCEDDDTPSVSAFFKMLRDRPEFAQDYARAREAHADHLFDECLAISDAPVETAVDVADKRVRIDTRMRRIAQMSPKRYFLEGRGGRPGEEEAPERPNTGLDFSLLDADEREAFRQLLLKATPGAPVEGDFKQIK